MIYQFRVILSALDLVYKNCSLTFKRKSYFVFLQKPLSSDVFCNAGCSWRFPGFCRTEPVFQSLFNQTTGLRVSSFIDEYLPMTASDSINFDILLGLFLYSVSFVISIYFKLCFQSNICILYLLLNVRNIFFIYFNCLFTNNFSHGLISDFMLFDNHISLFLIVNYLKVSASVVKNDLLNMQDWESQWKMSFNHNEVKQINHKRLHFRALQISVKIYLFTLPMQDTQKHPGLQLKNKLSFKGHPKNKISRSRYRSSSGNFNLLSHTETY